MTSSIEHLRRQYFGALTDEIRKLESSVETMEWASQSARAGIFDGDVLRVPVAEFAAPGSLRTWQLVPNAIHVVCSARSPRDCFFGGRIPSGLKATPNEAICLVAELASEGHSFGPRGGARAAAVSRFFVVAWAEANAELSEIELGLGSLPVGVGLAPDTSVGSGPILNVQRGWPSLEDCRAWFADSSSDLMAEKARPQRIRMLKKEISLLSDERSAIRMSADAHR